MLLKRTSVVSLISASLGLALRVSSGHAQAATVFKPDREFFFAHCKSIQTFKETADETAAVPFGKPVALTASNKETINTFFDYWEQIGDGDQRKLAYILATAYRESQGTLEPIREAPKCKTDETCRENAIAKALASEAAKHNRPVRDNYALPAANRKRYYGRGYIQLTLPDNYEQVGKKLGLGNRLYDDPELALQPQIAKEILFRGLIDGGYFGHKRLGKGPQAHYIRLSDYFDGLKAEWAAARLITNPGSDNKDVTGDLGKEFNACLR